MDTRSSKNIIKTKKRGIGMTAEAIKTAYVASVGSSLTVLFNFRVSNISSTRTYLFITSGCEVLCMSAVCELTGVTEDEESYVVL